MLQISTSKWLSAGLMACAAAFAMPAIAGPVVYSNGLPNQASGNDMNFSLQAENFVLASNTTISDIHFWSLEAANAYRGGFSWALYTNASGAPGAAISSGFESLVTRTSLGAVLGLGTEFKNEFDIAATALTAGTYWLVLHNGLLSNLGDTDPAFLWETTALAGRLGGQDDLTTDLDSRAMALNTPSSSPARTPSTSPSP